MNIENLSYQVLFDQISSVMENYREMDRVTGDSFNIFRILKMETAEVRMHSAFIGDLLNAKGRHGQGKVFLDLFMRVCSQKDNSIDSSSCKTYVEFHVGTMNEEKTEGGRVDIMVVDKSNRHVIIENKIHAPDQANQMIRYFGRANHVDLFYLTLKGDLPKKNSYGKLKPEVDFCCISYKDHIIAWLELCRKESAVLPILRESISQYINLIKYLTNQTINHQMQEKISSIIQSNLEESFAIRDNFEETLSRMSEEFGEKVREAFSGSGFECTYEIDFSRNYSGIWFYRPEWAYLKIGFQFQSRTREMVYGFTKHVVGDNGIKSIPDELDALLWKIDGNMKKPNDWWAWRRNVDEPFDNWSRFEAWQAIANGEMLTMIKQKVADLEVLAGDDEIRPLMLGNKVFED